MNNKGFTLLEVLAALAIAATALMVLLARSGASADLQHALALHAQAITIAVNELERRRLPRTASESALFVQPDQGSVQTSLGVFHWHSSVEKTEMRGFVRENMEVSGPDGKEVRLFLYRISN